MKMNFKLAQKDIRLILTALIVVILVGAWYINGEFQAKVDAVNAEINVLKTKKDDLSRKYVNKSMYVVKGAVYEALYGKIINKYSAGLDEETIIMDLRDIEVTTNTWIKTAGFAGVGTLYSFGSIRSSNPATEGSIVYVSDLKGVGSTTNLSFEGTYEDIKILLDRVNNSTFKYKIDTLTFTYNETLDMLTGSMALNNYAIKGGDRFFPATTVDGVPLGTSNIFKSDTYTSNMVDKTYLDVIKTNYDLYLYLNADTSDVESFVMGMRNDVLGKAQVTKNSNTRENIVINVTGTEGNYKISYKIGDEVYPSADLATGADFTFGDTLDVLVVSTPRIGQYDQSEAYVTVINGTDVKLNIGILNDDPDRPRFFLEKTVGSVDVYQ